MARIRKKRKLPAVFLFLAGILFVACMIGVFTRMIVLQKQWTDFKIDLAEAAADGSAENSVIVQDGETFYILHAQNCQWLCSQIMAAKQLPFQREIPKNSDLILAFPNGSVMELTEREDNGVFLSFLTADGESYRFALGELAKWDTYYTILTEGFAFKNVSASPEAMLIP